jgi:carboxyl-terminal processing protease
MPQLSLYFEATNSWGVRVDFIIKILWASFAMVFSLEEPAFAKQEDLWKASTNITEQHIKNLLTQERCYTNENNFLGCIEAIDFLFASSDPRYTLTNKTTAQFTSSKELVKVVEGLEVRKLSVIENAKVSPAEAVLKEKAKKDTSNASWKKLYSETKGKQLSIERLLTEALYVRSKDYPVSAIAESINQYLINALDPHTTIYTTKSERDAETTKAETFTGIGVELRLRDGNIELHPMENSPALLAGVRNKDILSKVEGTPITVKEFSEISNKIKGPDKSTVKITVLRNGKPIDLKITRGAITTENISGQIKIYSKTNTKVGVIKLLSFSKDDVCKDFIKMAQALRSVDAQSLVLDLRGNGGGLVNEALCMASLYIDNGKTILTYRDPITNEILDQTNDAGPAGLYNLFNNKPLVILTNAHSASASELLPGAIKAHGRAITVGVKTFGKGTMQAVRDAPEFLAMVGLENLTGVTLHKTVARFHFGDGSTNQLVGIEPDFKVYSAPNAVDEDIGMEREADMFPNAFSSAIRPKGISSDLKASISACMRENTNPLSDYEKANNSALGGDLQLITAVGVASCI